MARLELRNQRGAGGRAHALGHGADDAAGARLGGLGFAQGDPRGLQGCSLPSGVNARGGGAGELHFADGQRGWGTERKADTAEEA